ncbi:hypothetical protein [Streptomyces sp. UNOC14_S4]|uniref:hypothetical protein n=1 Tax=Streptomyces sp. UNOC14_S4 TaxID=2872340 RepID=UPI001E55F301|nr:hypothetical protein [Streptomyces sp. UNOC14_S4]MCC3771201.1 hypothetical protein [Streptomyces sp. UNOC14_S4]
MTLSSLVLVGSSLMWAPAGEARGGDGGSFLCTGSNTSTYDPPLMFTPQSVRVRAHAQYTCTVAPGRTVPAAGSLDVLAPGTACLALTHPGGTETVEYADGARSVIVYDSSTTERVAGALFTRLTGQVTEGRGKGLPAQRTADLLPGDLPTECLGSGIRESSGSVQLEAHL